MTRLFGTDGVRAEVNTGQMTAENIIRLALGAGKYFLTKNQDKEVHSGRRPLVVIGKDTRLSGYMIEAALQAGFASIGMDTRLLGPLPTPGVAYLTRTLRADLGVMISASHNPYYDNGIKLFGPDGYKLPDLAEDAIADIIAGDIPLASPENLGRARRMLDGVGRYVEAAKVAIPRRMRFEGIKVVVDCANGSAYRAAPDALFELGADVIPLADNPDGTNINNNCGAVHPQTMAEAVVAHGADIGIAFDGDADRLILSDEKGGILDGDHCLAVIAESMASMGTLVNKGVVGTLMTNHGLKLWLDNNDISLERVRVGDRYILEKMRTEGYNLGGEPSGHILMTDHATSGDALMVALKMLAALKGADKPASTALRRFTALPQQIINIRGKDKGQLAQILTSDKVKMAINEGESMLEKRGRVVVRLSGTETLLRVMIEAEDSEKMNVIGEAIACSIREQVV